MERMSRPLVSASRYELIASGPAFVSAFTVEERSLGGKYRIDRKLVVVLLPSPKRGKRRLFACFRYGDGAVSCAKI